MTGKQNVLAVLISTLLYLGVALPSLAQDCSNLDTLGWLTGEWEAIDQNNVTTEFWQRVSAETFEGSGRVVGRENGDLRGEESLRLVAMGGSVFFVAKPRQNDVPVPFKLVSCPANEAVFENLDHDFPKRLRYVRVGTNGLRVEVSDAADGGFTLQFKLK